MHGLLVSTTTHDGYAINVAKARKSDAVSIADSTVTTRAAKSPTACGLADTDKNLDLFSKSIGFELKPASLGMCMFVPCMFADGML